MRIAIMQPYLYPYIGYFQLINAVDKFVLYDDVNFINRGWVNRNNVLVNQKAHLFTMPLNNATQNKKINEIEIASDERWRTKFIQTLKLNYKKAPRFHEVMPFLETALDIQERNLASFNRLQIQMTCNYLDIQTTIISSSGIDNNAHLKKDDRIINICKREHAETYINPAGGVDIYDREKFNRNGISLFFLKSDLSEYKQFNQEFIPWLSIIDIMMFNTKEEIKQHLQKFHLE